MKKRVVSLLLCLIMALSLIPTVAFAAEPAVDEQPVEETLIAGGDKIETASIQSPLKLGWMYANITNDSGTLNVSNASSDKDFSKNVTVTLERLILTSTMAKDEYYYGMPAYDGSNKVTVTAKGDYYIAYVAFCCRGSYDLFSNPYDCTAPQTLYADNGSNVKSVSFTLKQLRDMQNQAHKEYCWLMVMLAPTTNSPVEPVSTGTLTIRKQVVGNVNSSEFKINVKGTNYDVTQVVGDGEPVLFKDLLFGTYTITEIDADIDGYDLTTTYGNQEASSYDVTLDENNQAVTVAVTNTYTPNEMPPAGTVSIPVQKNWENDKPENRPGNIGVQLMKNGTVVDTLTLTAPNWSGDFKAVSYTAGDQFTVKEVTALNDYNVIYKQPKVSPLSVGDTWAKINVANQSNNFTGNLLVIKPKGSEKITHVWTDSVLSSENKTALITAINAAIKAGKLSGFGQANLTANNTTFISLQNPVSGISVVSAGDNKYTITFTDTSMWSLCFSGTLSLPSYTAAIITNTLKTSPPPANVTAKIYIDKRIDVSTGSRQPDPTTFTFKASYVDKDGKEMPIPKGEFSIKYNGGTDSSITGDWTLNIPRSIFDSNNNNNNNEYITVFIKEVNSKVPGWTYSNDVYTLHIDSNGDVKVPFVDNKEWILHNERNPLMFANTYTYTPPARPSDPIRRQPTTTTTKPVQSVKTGDMGIALYAVTSLLSLSGTALVIKKRKDEE